MYQLGRQLLQTSELLISRYGSSGSHTNPTDSLHTVLAVWHKDSIFSVSAFCFQGAVEVQQLDLADLSSVNTLASRLQSEAKIDMLILNAGVAWGPLRYTKDNFEMQVGTNHFGHFALVQSLLPKLKQQVRFPYHVQLTNDDDMRAPVQIRMSCRFKTKSNTIGGERILHITSKDVIPFSLK